MLSNQQDVLRRRKHLPGVNRLFTRYNEASRFLKGLRFKMDERIFDARDYKADNPLAFLFSRLFKNAQMQGARLPEERGVPSRTGSDEGRGQRRRWAFFNSLAA
jgi:hypothetical protein